MAGTVLRTPEDILPETDAPDEDENSWCLTGPEDEVRAWAAFTPRGDVLESALVALPGPSGATAARALLCLLLDRADELAGERGERLSIAVDGVPSADPVVPCVLAEAGFVHVRTMWRLDLDLLAPPLPPLPPDGGDIRRADDDDTEALHALHLRSQTLGLKTGDVQAFRTRLRRLHEADGVTLLLETAGRPAGYVLARPATGGGRIMDLAVDPALRGLGIDVALLLAALADLRARGCRRALVTVDTGDLDDFAALGRVLTVHSAHLVARYDKDTD